MCPSSPCGGRRRAPRISPPLPIAGIRYLRYLCTELKAREDRVTRTKRAKVRRGRTCS
uniref:Uncharacterized protein n=1 Tax=Arundo donax TaxID=35708 RepID=A0A0A9ARK5_ARUDO